MGDTVRFGSLSYTFAAKEYSCAHCNGVIKEGEDHPSFSSIGRRKFTTRVHEGCYDRYKERKKYLTRYDMSTGKRKPPKTKRRTPIDPARKSLLNKRNYLIHKLEVTQDEDLRVLYGNQIKDIVVQLGNNIRDDKAVRRPIKIMSRMRTRSVEEQMHMETLERAKTEVLTLHMGWTGKENWDGKIESLWLDGYKQQDIPLPDEVQEVE